MTRHGFIWSLLAMVLAPLGLPKSKHGDRDGENVWVSRQHYDTKLAHMRQRWVVEKGQCVERVGLPKILRQSAWNDTYLVSGDDVIAHAWQNLLFSAGA